MKPSIRAVGVAVPARNEVERIERCLDALVVAADACDVDVFLAVAADRCQDDTVAVARRALASLPRHVGAEVIECCADSVGSARQLACRHAVAGTARDRDSVWLAVTDADSVVPAGWLTSQLRWAAEGLDGVAGLVTLDDTDSRPDRARNGFTEWAAARGTGMGHPHVYAANLGLRASWWNSVGGFSPLAVGEDADLWRRLRRSGATLLGVDNPIVVTSGRTVGRTPGGFAGLMNELAQHSVPVPG